MRPFVSEMRWAFSWEAVVVGVGIFAVWVGLDPFYPKLIRNGGATGNPNDTFGEGSALAWFFIAVHILGMTFVVPPLEEVFYRSFLYRYIARQDFLSVPLNRFLPCRFSRPPPFSAFRTTNGWRAFYAARRINGWCSAKTGWATR